MSLNPDSENLMARYLDGRLNAAEASELAELLTADPQAAERFAELTRVDEALRVELKAERRSGLFAARMERGIKPAKPSRQPADRRRWLTAAAGLTVMGAGALWLAGNKSPEAVGRELVQSKLNNRTFAGDAFDPDYRTAFGGRTADAAADLRRKLRGFALPPLQMRGTAVSDALAMLRQQWTDLPHRHASAGKAVKIDFSPGVRQLWPTREDEPLVTLDVPGVSLQTALNLLAAQAGLRVDVTATTVSLERDPRVAESAAQAEKTWTFPLPKATADVFLASFAQKPVSITTRFLNAEQSKLTDLSYNWLLEPYVVQHADVELTRDFTFPTDYDAPQIPQNSATPANGFPVASTAVPNHDPQTGEYNAVTSAETAEPTAAVAWNDYSIDLNLSPEVVEIEGSITYENHSLETTGQAVENAGTTQPTGETKGVPLRMDAKVKLSGGAQHIFDQGYQAGKAAGSYGWSYVPPQVAAAPATLPAWLAAAGVPAEGIREDAESGVLSVTADPQALRAAAAAVAALTESVQAGYSVEMRLIPAENPEADGLFKDGKPTEILTSSKVEELSASKGNTPVSKSIRIPRATAARGGWVRLQLDGKEASLLSSQSLSDDGRTASWVNWDIPEVYKTYAVIDATFLAAKSGEIWTLKGSVTGASKTFHNLEFTAGDSEWSAVELESGGALLIRVTSGTVSLP